MSVTRRSLSGQVPFRRRRGRRRSSVGFGGGHARECPDMFGATTAGTWSRPTTMPVDAIHNGDEFVIAFDLPGVDADAIDIDWNATC